MRILIIGATGFIGGQVARQLQAAGHELILFHRGRRVPSAKLPARSILGDYGALQATGKELRLAAPDVLIDMLAATQDNAAILLNVFRGFAGRLVVLSSMDVYRAFDVLKRTDSGPLEPVPLLEDSPLREKLYPFRTLPTRPYDFPPDYDKILVERELQSDPQLPCTVLRLPMVYGPGDPFHRFLGYIKRMDDRRPVLPLWDEEANWRGTRGYVEDVARAIALAAVQDSASGRVFNVGEPSAMTTEGLVRSLGAEIGWKGRVLTFTKQTLPPHLFTDANARQDWIISTDRIRSELGFTEMLAYEERLRRTIAWERGHAPRMDGLPQEYASEDRLLQKMANVGL